MPRSIVTGLVIALIIAGVVSPFASSAPDGLERVAENLGFIHLFEEEAVFDSLMPEYVVPGISHDVFSGALSGVIGVILTFGITLLIGKTLRNNKGEMDKDVRG